MPELPDVELYLHALRPRLVDKTLKDVRIASPFVLRTVEPSLEQVKGKRVLDLQRLGKRVVLGLEDELYIVIHLMIAGRFRWRKPGCKIPSRLGLAAFDFEAGTLLLTEASKKKRAALHLCRGKDTLREHDPGGIEPLEVDLARFSAALRERNHTVKRALTDPRILSGIGNAYSDEILHRAELSPLIWTTRMNDEQLERLHAATREVLSEWLGRLIEQHGEAFPEKVTAFRPEMAAHGKYGEPCPTCGDPIQRIVFAQRETNYCATCQTGGKLLADRALSKLLKGDWPRSLEELEALRRG
ncbi:MAG: formamidopyrimidine-DNA glycosylase [Deltaproteobacteria bacterium]|nr:formamidopyrimidine-DNA glycosylase [Deltaproteobacteria bacterium]NND27114.1 formamidopyrimidine-DNA glycosylase [Myxococcales bacterium]MBT8466705.1 formamidopyrimidine-DNA glycosylase [Deltaproteobacteria bacterium]MBT8483716.1 formamidopyrimidine-DNA glycosylase [Deltaproteobacteria bacterium]NNK09242.1 formamidopyrimidine-DNA glycosylase [Myxococcales bacterium]